MLSSSISIADPSSSSERSELCLSTVSKQSPPALPNRKAVFCGDPVGNVNGSFFLAKEMSEADPERLRRGWLEDEVLDSGLLVLDVCFRMAGRISACWGVVAVFLLLVGWSDTLDLAVLGDLELAIASSESEWRRLLLQLKLFGGIRAVLTLTVLPTRSSGNFFNLTSSFFSLIKECGAFTIFFETLDVSLFGQERFPNEYLADVKTCKGSQWKVTFVQ